VKEMLRRTDITLGEMLRTQALRDPGLTVLVCEEEKKFLWQVGHTRTPSQRAAVAPLACDYSRLGRDFRGGFAGLNFL
jgi:hypothetical protein